MIDPAISLFRCDPRWLSLSRSGSLYAKPSTACSAAVDLPVVALGTIP
jgi:hypothetical protein